jgi:hypothetical protein
MGTLHKQDILRHIAEAQRRIEDLRWRMASAEQAGGDSSGARQSLRLFEEALAHLIASREALLREKDQQG